MKLRTTSTRLACVLALLPSTLYAGDWPHWRGPQRNDVIDEDSGWDSGAWPLKKPAWKVDVGSGGTSPLVVGDKVYVAGWGQAKDHVQCLNAATGQTQWRQSYPCPEYGRHRTGDEGLYSGVSATPEFDPATGVLYTLSTDGDLRAWDTRQEGRGLWSLNLYQQYGVGRRPQITKRSGTLRDYGYTTAPLVHGEWLLVEVGDDEGTVMAFEKKSGERVWSSSARGCAGHTGGMAPMIVEGVPCVASLTPERLIVVRLDRDHVGETVAEYPWPTDFANNIASPAVHENFVLITSAYNRKAICKLRITLRGAEKVWEQPYYSGICTPVIYEGHVYWANQTMQCLDFETGEQLWHGGAFGDAGSCIATRDGRIIVWARQGDLVLVEGAKRSPKKYQELARLNRTMSSDVWPHVVLSNGRLLCKDRNGTLACYSIK